MTTAMYRKERGSIEKITDNFATRTIRTSAWTVIVLISAIALQLVIQAWPAIQKFGPGFVFGTEWNPVRDRYGAFPFIVGTLESSVLAMMIAAPIGLATAVFLNEDFLPGRIRAICTFSLELLAAIPSVVYGLWGIFVLIPSLVPVSNWLNARFSACPLFSTPLHGSGLLPAALVLALMVLPTIAAFSRTALEAAPPELRQGAYALGATRWEALITVIIPSARIGLSAAFMLALGRALGETMAVAMLIGNSTTLSLSLFAPANSISAHLANQFGEASGLQMSSLMYCAVLLLGVSLLTNHAAANYLRGKTT